MLHKILKQFRHPHDAISRLMALAWGSFYIMYYRLFRRKVKICFPFFAHEKVVIEGPGSVFIGPGCSVHTNVFDGLCIVTLTSEAEVHIGRNCSLGGVTVRCASAVTMGERTMTANCLFQDTVCAFGDRIEGNPIVLGKNVWVGMGCTILGGAVIGDNAVLAMGSAVSRHTIPHSTLAFGNPVQGPFLPLGPLKRMLEG